MARASPRKKVAVNYAETEDKQDTSIVARQALSNKGATSKRKAVDPVEEPAVAPKPSAKKRKTKGKDKDEDAMPLAERTAIAALKKPMYIGAHVSAAGGRISLAKPLLFGVQV